MRSVRFAIAVCAIVLLLQFAIPAIHLFSDGSNRWGWQMYSRLPDRVEVWAISANGNQAHLPLTSMMVHHRYELRFDESALDRVCALEPGAVALHVERRFEDDVVRHECPG